MFLLGEFLDAEKAKALGLLNRVVPGGELAEAGAAFARPLVHGGPFALASVKEMLDRLPTIGPEEARDFTTALIAKLRASPEGQEGMTAFLEKRRPNWLGGEG
jgi:methylglutaconyl-CoA hydratase